jgi:hypothetical protein
VWEALTANPGATVAVIADTAGVSKSAARKALTALAAGGHATRTAGGREGGKRTPDAWHATTPTTPVTPSEVTDSAPAGDSEPASDEIVEAEAGATADGETSAASAETAPADTHTEPPAEEAGGDQTDPAADTTPDPTSEDATPETAGGEETGDPADTAGEAGPAGEGEQGEDPWDPELLGEAINAVLDMGSLIGSVMDALGAGDRQTAVEKIEAVYSGSGRTRRLVRAAATGRRRTASDRPKSAPGELRGKVEAHLAEYPGQEFTPHQIGKAIGHSSGAVANALDRLVEFGTAVETSERPRRFTAAPSTAEATGALRGATA